MGGEAMKHEDADTNGRAGNADGRGIRRIVGVINLTNATVGTIAILIGWGAGLILALHINSNHVPNTVVKITSPTPGAISREVVVQGIVHHLPDGKSLWVDTQDLSDLKHNPNDRECTVTGDSFQCGQIFVGSLGQRNHSFQLEIWIVGLNQIQEINNYNSTAEARSYPGLTTPPDGTTIETSIQVLRS
jgi:hypothetical protein